MNTVHRINPTCEVAQMTDKPLITRDDLYVTVDFQHNAEVRLLKHFGNFIRAEHERRGEPVSPRFVTKWARSLVNVMRNELHLTAEDELGCINAGEYAELPEWNEKELGEAVANTEEWYQWMLKQGAVKPSKPGRKDVASAVFEVGPLDMSALEASVASLDDDIDALLDALEPKAA
jgi:hypothetical protein